MLTLTEDGDPAQMISCGSARRYMFSFRTSCRRDATDWAERSIQGCPQQPAGL